MNGDDRYALESFELYNRAREFRKKVYVLIRQLPREERFCLDPQMRRAVVSVTNNIAEGHGRWYYQDNIRFLRMSRGSLGELMDDFNLCIDQNYGNPNLVSELCNDAKQLLRRVNGYIRYLRKSKQGYQDSPITNNQ